ncbi:zinc finger protein 62-like isoform X2 [Bicyclus anynana]|uniref:Zinc finger protein 62-like isoform X2 n=1 Tax=Bicyclus anynana TaxID=110368 RepID=A0ABM3M2K2_BICAN|nr:zinc finger protein 62-like isoform X2 [Bicyclus anynana]
MQCCVPFCVNTSDNASISEGPGITFHELPSKENLHAAWLKALGTQDHHLPDPAVVCSQHFLDEDFYETKSCVRQICSNAIPTTVQMCMICLDTDSKLSLMSKHKLEEAYEQLTGLSLCRGGNLKQTLCVLCAQRLINFSRFKDLCLRAHSLMTDLLAQDELITIQHKELMNCTTKHLKFNLTQITLVNHCDLYVDHTDEEEQTAAEESIVGVVASIVPKKEDSFDSMSNSDYSELTHKDDNLIDNACVSNNNYSNTSIKLEPYSLDEGTSIHESLHAKAGAFCTTLTEHVPETENFIKIESVTFGCTFCHEEFMQENEYYEHMSEHLQYAVGDAACDASQVCEPCAAVSRSDDSLVLQNKSVYNDAACDASQVCEPRAAVSRSGDSLVLQNKSVYNDAACDASQVCEPRAAVSRSGDSLVLQNKSVYNDAACDASQVCEPRAAVSRSGDSLVLQNKSVYNDAAGDASQVCEPRAAVSRSGDSLVLQNKSVYNDAACDASQVCEPRAAVSRSGDSLVLQNKSVYNDAACDASQVCEPRAAVSRSGDSLVLQNKTGSRRLNDVPPLAADCAQALVAPLSARLAANNDYKVQATEEAAATRKTEQILETDIGELDNQSSQSGTKIYTDINRFTNTGEKLCERVKTADKTRQGSFVRHLKTNTGELRYSCDVCHYKCAQKNNLVRHLRTHTGEKPYCCEICNFKCSDKSALSLHILTHTGEKPFCCEICNYRCAHKGDLTKHKITHTGEKPYSCEKCSYKSAQKSYLKRHQRTHTNEKPFSCEICNYKCKMKSELNRHERTHTGEKPFCCETCNHRFANRGDLKKHERTHTGEKPFSCEICKYKSAHKHNLLNHMKTHTGEKPFSCDICNYKSSDRFNLLRHMKRKSHAHASRVIVIK